MTHRIGLVLTACTVVMVVVASVGTASAQEAHATVGAGAEQHEEGGHASNSAGVKFINLNAFERTHGAEGDKMEVSPHFGGTMFYERAFFHHRVEAELNAIVASTEGGVRVPIEAIVKVVFRDPSASLRPFVGAGPALHLLLAEEKDAFFEVAATLGFVYWFSESIGLDVEVDYGMVFEEELVHEVGPSLGPVLKF